jgi:hypothetical protein
LDNITRLSAANILSAAVTFLSSGLVLNSVLSGKLENLNDDGMSEIESLEVKQKIHYDTICLKVFIYLTLVASMIWLIGSIVSLILLKKGKK